MQQMLNQSINQSITRLCFQIVFRKKSKATRALYHQPFLTGSFEKKAESKPTNTNNHKTHTHTHTYAYTHTHSLSLLHIHIINNNTIREAHQTRACRKSKRDASVSRTTLNSVDSGGDRPRRSWRMSGARSGSSKLRHRRGVRLPRPGLVLCYIGAVVL